MIEEITIFFQIVLIDLVLAGDNAIIIGMVASQFDPHLRKKIIFWGIGAAIVLRIVFTSIATYLLQVDGLRAIGGLLLLYISYIFYKEVVYISLDNKLIPILEKFQSSHHTPLSLNQFFLIIFLRNF